MANRLLNASDFFKGGYNFLVPTDAWEKSDDKKKKKKKLVCGGYCYFGGKNCLLSKAV